jgi:TetR/AcrR family transcriptional repressor of mexJK operon
MFGDIWQHQIGHHGSDTAERRHERIIDAATLFMERGLEGTLMDAVADIAGVSKPTVYARYREKKELFVAVLQRRIKRWLAPLSGGGRSADGSSRPRRYRGDAARTEPQGAGPGNGVR